MHDFKIVGHEKTQSEQIVVILNIIELHLIRWYSLPYHTDNPFSMNGCMDRYYDQNVTTYLVWSNCIYINQKVEPFKIVVRRKLQYNELWSIFAR